MASTTADPRITDAIEQILTAEENRQSTGLFPTELSTLACLVAPATGTGFADVDADLLSPLIALLEHSITAASQINLLEQAAQVLKGDGLASLDTWLEKAGMDAVIPLRMGLEAAAIMLQIMATPGLDRKVVTEEAVGATIVLARHHLTNHLVPSINQIAHLTYSQTSKEKDEMISSPTAATLSAKRKKKRLSTARKRRRSTPTMEDENISKEAAAEEAQASVAAVLMDEYPKMYDLIETTTGRTIQVLEGLQALLQRIPLDDQHVFHLSGGMLVCLELDPSTFTGVRHTRQLQVASFDVLTALFRRYPTHRSMILEDIFPFLLKMPTLKKTMRSFAMEVSPISCPPTLARLMDADSSVPWNPEVQPLTALVVGLMQCAVARPTLQPQNEGGQEQDSAPIPPYSNGLASSQACMETFCRQMLIRCARKGTDGGASEYRPILQNFLQDLLMLQLVPEYPAAQALIGTLANLIARQLQQITTPRALQNMETTYLSTIMDAFGTILAAQAKLLAAQREHTAPTNNQCSCGKLVSPDSTSTHKTPVVNCGNCKTWFHKACAGSEIVGAGVASDSWLCDECQLKRIAEVERHKAAQLLQGAQGEGGGSWSHHGLESKSAEDSQPSADSQTWLTPEFCQRRLVMDYLAHLAKSHRIGSVRDAYYYQMAQWIGEISQRHQQELIQQKSGEEASLLIASPLQLAMLSELWDPQEATMAMPATSAGAVVVDTSSPTLNSMFNCLSEAGRTRILLAVAARSSPPMLTFKPLVEITVRLMGSPAGAMLRKLAVKAIDKIVEGDTKLMLYAFVKKAVMERFNDDAISVREAVLGLVGGYASQRPEVARAFHSSFLKGLHDPGVSVRKRTIKILAEIMGSNPSYHGRASACSAMLQLAANPKEDDGVRDLVHDLFMKVWLMNGEEKILHTVEATPTSESSPTKPKHLFSPSSAVMDVEVLSPEKLRPPPPISRQGDNHTVSEEELALVTPRPTRSAVRKVVQARSEIASEQMVEVVKAAGTGDTLVSLLRELLSGVNEADKGKRHYERLKRQEVAKSQCDMLVNSLFEILLKVEERRPKLGKGIGAELVATVRTIQVFGAVCPHAVVLHIDTILPYLKADNGATIEEEGEISKSLCITMANLSTCLIADGVKRLEKTSLGTDLVKITYKFGREAVDAAVKALSAFAQHPATGEANAFRNQVLSLASTFFQFLQNHKDKKDFSRTTKKLRLGVQRALGVLGAICHYHEVDSTEVDMMDEDDSENNEQLELTWNGMTREFQKLFLEYMDKNDAPTKCAALRALGGVFISRPRVLFAMDRRGLIAEVMSPSSALILQLEALRVWKDILLSEEARIESGEAKRKMDAKKGISVSIKVSGDQDGDATLFGGVLTSHAARLFEMSQDKDEALRFATLDLLGHLMRQGQINPIETIPYLFALQGDIGNDRIRSLALKILMIEGKKRPDVLRQRICAGVQRAHVFQSSVYPDRDPSALILVGNRVECVFGRIFEECIRTRTKQRQGLFRNLLGLFDSSEGTFTDAEPLKTKNGASLHVVAKNLDLPLLSFTAQVLAHLPYSSSSDPLYIIHAISSTVAIVGAALLDRIAAFLRPYGLSGTDEYDDTNTEEDAIEVAAKQKVPRHAEEIHTMTQRSFDILGFCQLCGEAAAICLLLRLKSFLRKSYNLSEARILGYNPDATERNFEKVISLSLNTKFDAQLSLRKVPDNKKNVDFDGLVRQYAEFRQLMRDESAQELAVAEYSDDEGNEGAPLSAKKRLFTE